MNELSILRVSYN